MHYLAEIRSQWGLSQQEFADLIGCSRGQLSMAESVKRSLPAASLLIIYRLEGTKPKPHHPYERPAVVPNDASLKALDLDMRKRQLQVFRLENLLEQLDTKIQQTLHLAEMATTLLESEPRLPEPGHSRLIHLQQKARAANKRHQKKWLLCQVELAGYRAAMAKAVELKLI